MIIRSDLKYPDKYKFAYSQLKDELGMAGQGNTNPFKDFNTHYCTEFKGEVFDPSYGIRTKGSATDHRERAVQFYLKVLIATLNETKFGDLNNNGVIDKNAKFKILFVRKNNLFKE